jgi:hypothetical protein
MKRMDAWERLARTYLKLALDTNREALAEDLLLHEPGCDRHDQALVLLRLNGLSLEAFLADWWPSRGQRSEH